MWKWSNEVATCFNTPSLVLSQLSKNSVTLNLILLQEQTHPPNTDFTKIHQCVYQVVVNQVCSVLEVKPNKLTTLTKIIIYWASKWYLLNKVPVISGPFLETWFYSSEVWERNKIAIWNGYNINPSNVCSVLLWKSRESQYIFPKSSKFHSPHGSQNWTDGIYSITDPRQMKRICWQKLIRDNLILPAADWLAGPHQTFWRQPTVSNRC